MREKSGSALPSWLDFNDETNRFEGFPTVYDTGVYYIVVIAHGEDGSQAKDAFSIDVVASSNPPDTHGCSESRTLLNVLFDVDLKSLTAKERIQFFTTVVEFLNLTKVRKVVTP